jgi:hypothetical protein
MAEEPQVDRTIGHFLNREQSVFKPLAPSGQGHGAVSKEALDIAAPQQNSLAGVLLHQLRQHHLERFVIGVDLGLELVLLHGLPPEPSIAAFRASAINSSGTCPTTRLDFATLRLRRGERRAE